MKQHEEVSREAGAEDGNRLGLSRSTVRPPFLSVSDRVHAILRAAEPPQNLEAKKSAQTFHADFSEIERD